LCRSIAFHSLLLVVAGGGRSVRHRRCREAGARGRGPIAVQPGEGIHVGTSTDEADSYSRCFRSSCHSLPADSLGPSAALRLPPGHHAVAAKCRRTACICFPCCRGMIVEHCEHWNQPARSAFPLGPTATHFSRDAMLQFHLIAPLRHCLSTLLTRPFISRTAANMTILPFCPADGAPSRHKLELERCLLRLT